MEPANSEAGSSHETRLVHDEPPPFLRTWARLYAAVLGYLFALIIVLYVITKYLNRL